MREPALIEPEPRTTTRCFEVRPDDRLLTAACTAARMSVPVYAVVPPLRAVQVPPLSTASALTEPLPQLPGGGVVGGVPLPTRARSHCWLAPPASVYCEMRPPSAVDHSHTSRALPLCRLSSRT